MRNGSDQTDERDMKQICSPESKFLSESYIYLKNPFGGGVPFSVTGGKGYIRPCRRGEYRTEGMGY